MSDSEDIEDIRERKLEELQESARDDDPSGPDSAADATPSEPVHLADVGDYDAFVADHDVALVDFHAEWCGPCRMLEPVVEEVAAGTDAAVLKVDVDDHQRLARRMQVRGVPTLYLYSGGEVAEQLVGMQDEERLVDLVERAA